MDSDFEGEDDEEIDQDQPISPACSSRTDQDEDVDIMMINDEEASATDEPMVLDDQEAGSLNNRPQTPPPLSPSETQQNSTPSNNGQKTMSERGRRFLIDCLLNLPKEDPSSCNLHHSLRNNESGSSLSSALASSSGSSQQLQMSSPGQTPTSGSSSTTHFSWNGLSKPSEIRKVYSANTTWPLWIYYTRYTHRPQQQLAAAAHHSASSTQLIGNHHNQGRVGKSQSALNNPGTRGLGASSFATPSASHQSSSSSGANSLTALSRLNSSGSSSARQSSSSASTKSPSTGRRSSPHSSRRVRLAFTAEQLNRLKEEFECNHYLNEPRRKAIAGELNLKEAQVKVWFQNKRAQLRRICNASSFFFLQTSPTPSQGNGPSMD